MPRKKKTRKQWSEAQKRKVLARADKIRQQGGNLGDFYESQGVFSSQITNWRKALGVGGGRVRVSKQAGKRSVPSGDAVAAVQALQEENQVLRTALMAVDAKLAAAIGA